MSEDTNSHGENYPKQVYQEMALRIPEGDRSTFIREAIAKNSKKHPNQTYS